jgi:tetratricopeptide (TPR) repeat protein
LAKSFGYQLLVRQEVPVRLEPLRYTPPTDLSLNGLRVLVFATRFSDPRAETQYESAVPEIEAGRLAAGEAKLDAALAMAPKSAEFWLIKAHLLLARGDVNAAIHAVANAIRCAGQTQVYSICTAEAVRLYHAGAHAAAAELYRRAASVQPTAEVLNNLAWILATSRDDAARNGSEALEIAERVARDHPDYLALSGYAAALAECRRYDDAATIAERAVAVARDSGNVALVKKAEACLGAYRNRTAWRE